MNQDQNKKLKDAGGLLLILLSVFVITKFVLAVLSHHPIIAALARLNGFTSRLCADHDGVHPILVNAGDLRNKCARIYAKQKQSAPSCCNWIDDR